MEKSLRFLANVIDTRASQTDKKPAIPVYAYRGQDSKPRSMMAGSNNISLRESPRYTGSAILGISTMHKSNSVPVFTEELIIDIARMRR